MVHPILLLTILFLLFFLKEFIGFFSVGFFCTRHPTPRHPTELFTQASYPRLLPKPYPQNPYLYLSRNEWDIDLWVIYPFLSSFSLFSTELFLFFYTPFIIKMCIKLKCFFLFI